MSEPTPRTWLDSIREQYGSLQSARLSGRKQDEAAATNWLHISVNEHWHDILEMQRTLAAQRTASPLLPGLERDAERYRARRYTIYKDRLRIEMPQGKNWRPTTFEDFCAEYDAACDKEIEKQATEISRLKGERSK